MATETVTVRKRPGMAAKSVRDMVLSLAAVMAAGLVIYYFIPHSGGNGVHAVPYQDSVPSARRAAPYPLLAPEGLPSGWNATSVNYDGTNADTWTLGFIDPSTQYVALEQSNAPLNTVVQNATIDAVKQSATTMVNGVAWTHYQGTRYQALVLPGAKGTTVVFGTESFAKLGDFAAKLSDH
ncbi:DUF4245 domain-containing protein [Streptacidiphilus fuscans]|nr:DUF4245 domain-containing protein [Streptacidiphilus fuscans]